jgi:DnaJ like chaperone protein
VQKLTRLFALWWGGLVLSLAGLLLYGLPGALIGLVLGLLLDVVRRFVPFTDSRWPARSLSRQERRFLITSFAAMGHTAKADGRVSEAEIAIARAIMLELGLEQARRQQAAWLFGKGKAPGFPLRSLLRRLRRSCAVSQHKRFLSFLVRVACADGRPSAAQLRVLRLAVYELRIPAGMLEDLLRRAAGRQRAGGGNGLRRTLSSAYGLLGIDETASDEEVRQAYRRAISRHHPDRMVAAGMSEAEIQAAARRTHRVRAAFDEIRRERSGGKAGNAS